MRKSGHKTVAEELGGDELDRGIGIFSRRSEAHGASAWTREDVTSPACIERPRLSTTCSGRRTGGFR